MILETKNKTINIVLRTRKIVDITNKLQGKNFEELYFKAMNENNLEALSKILFIFAEDEAGLSSFKSNYEAMDFIDDYKEENKKSYQDIFNELANTINDEGFFKVKMTKKELQEKISNPLSSLNMEEVIKNSAEKAISKVTEEQVFQGYKG